MSKARNIADLGSNDVLDTDGTGATVSGHLTVSDSTPDFVIQDTDGTNQLMKMQQVGGASMIKFRSDTNDGELYFTGEVTGNNKMKIATNGDITMYKDDGSSTGVFFDASSGSVGIGTGSLTGKLDVFTTSSRYQSFVSSTADLELVSSNNLTPILYIKGTGTADLVNVFDDTTEVFTIFDGGKVEVSLSASTGTYFEGGGTGDSAQARKFLITSSTTTNTGDTHTLNAESSTGNIAFATTGNERMRIQSDGSVQFKPDGVTADMTLDASGNLLVGGTTFSQNSSEKLSVFGRTGIEANGSVVLGLDRQISEGGILQFRKDNGTVGSIGTGSNRLYVGTSNVGLYFASAEVLPWNTSTNATRDNAIDLGNASGRWQDLYLSGGVYLGGTGSANLLDYYEEGTSTIGISAASGSGGTVSGGSMTWTRIGNQVIVAGNFSVSSLGTLSGNFYITGFPFAASASFFQAQGSVRSQGIGGSNDIPVVIEMLQGTSNARMHFFSGSSTQRLVAVTDISVSDFMAFGLTYQI